MQQECYFEFRIANCEFNSYSGSLPYLLIRYPYPIDDTGPVKCQSMNFFEPQMESMNQLNYANDAEHSFI